MKGAQTSLTVTQALADSQYVLHDSLLLEPLLPGWPLAAVCRGSNVSAVCLSMPCPIASTNWLCALPAVALCCLRLGRTKVGVSGCRQAPHGHQSLPWGRQTPICSCTSGLCLVLAAPSHVVHAQLFGQRRVFAQRILQRLECLGVGNRICVSCAQSVMLELALCT